MAKNIHITGDHTGDIGDTVVSGNSGPIVTNGNVYENTTVTSSSTTVDNRDGVTVIQGDHTGVISYKF